MLGLDILNHLKCNILHIVFHARLDSTEAFQKDKPAALIFRRTSLVVKICEVYLSW
jgi:hypothetical protein